MPLSLNTADFTTATIVAAGTPVFPVAQPSDNTHSIIVYNDHATARSWFQFGVAGPVLLDDSQFVPPGGSVTLGIGPRSQRAGGPDAESLRCDSDTNGAVLRITYLNGRTA
jgi:hypothetical protein